MCTTCIVRRCIVFKYPVTSLTIGHICIGLKYGIYTTCITCIF